MRHADSRGRLSLAIIMTLTGTAAGTVVLAFLFATTPQLNWAGEVHPGKLSYDLHCARCHGPNGLGDGPQASHLKVAPPNFQSATFQSRSDEQMLGSIEFGETRSQMHAWRGRLTEQELREVMAYIRRLGHTR
jgi:mono/diheme cytochrome c family protein